MSSEHCETPIIYFGVFLEHETRDNEITARNSGGEDADPREGTFQGQLTFTVEGVAYQLPVHQILRVIHRHPGEIAERRVHQIEVIPHPAHTGVRVKACDDGITQLRPRSQREQSKT